MARIRSIKPSFWSDEKLTQLDPLARMTFLGLISAMADDAGRCKGEIRLVKASIWPLDDSITPEIVANHLRSLHELKRILRYEHDGANYIQIVNWKKHQRIDKPRASELPPPPKGPPKRFVEDSPKPLGSVAEASALERSGADKEGSGIGSGADGAGTLDEFSGPSDDELDALDSDEWIPPSAIAAGDADFDLDPIVRHHDRQPSAPPAPLVELPVEAHRFVEQLYSLATEKRQLDVRRQLYDAINPTGRGARLRKGVFVKARSADHLAICCRAVLEDPPRNVDAAIVVLLEKLQDPPPGPTPAEMHKAESDAERAEEEAYHRDARNAGIRWARDHPDEYAPIVSEVDAHFNSIPDSGFKSVARESSLVQKTAAAAGFPSFEEWRMGKKTPAQNGARSGANASQTQPAKRLAAGGGR